jgi:hypothetical protein
MVYNIEHCIHHQALIKVALNEMEANHLINKNFGIAPSTIQYRKFKHKLNVYCHLFSAKRQNYPHF